MSRRNFILFIIILVIILGAVFAYLFLRTNTATPTSTDTGTNFLAQFNPFGRPTTTTPTTTTTTTPTTTTNETPTTNNNADIKLRKVSSMPIAGYISYSKERYKDVAPAATTDTSGAPTTTTKPSSPSTEFMTALRYVSQADGNIYQTFADKIDEKKFTTNTIPQVYESYFGAGASSVVMRYTKADGESIESFLGNIPAETLGSDGSGDNTVKGSFLPDNITDMSVSPDKSKLFYLVNIGENTVGNILNIADQKKTQVFSSAFNEWLTSWPNASTITLTAKPAFNVPGFAYALNTTNQSFSQILSGVNGLTTLMSPDGKLVLYGDNNGSLYIYHIDTHASDVLGLKTIPEKCVWSKMNYVLYCSVPRSLAGGALPDNWYRGEVSFNDQIWKIDMSTGTTTMVVDPLSITGGEIFDGVKLALDDKETYLFFVNKKDNYLWEYELGTPAPTAAPSMPMTPVKPTTPTTPAKTTTTTTTTTKTTTTKKPVVKSTTHTITIKYFTFSNDNITINRGESIIWVNKDMMQHTITGDNGIPSSKALPPGESYKYTFTKSGTYKYHCAIHPGMVGSVTVR